MPRKKTAADRARARERAKIEAEQLTGRSDLSHRQVADVLRAHRNGDDPLSALPDTTPARADTTTGRRTPTPAPSRRASPIRAHADHLIPPVRELDVQQQPLTVDGHEAVPLGVLLGGVQDFKILRGVTASLNITTSTEFRHLLADTAAISLQGHVLVCALYQIPRVAVFGAGDDDDADD